MLTQIQAAEETKTLKTKIDAFVAAHPDASGAPATTPAAAPAAPAAAKADSTAGANR